MTKTKIVLEDTLYVTMKIIDRSLMEDNEIYSDFETELDDLKAQIREVLDKLESTD